MGFVVLILLAWIYFFFKNLFYKNWKKISLLEELKHKKVQIRYKMQLNVKLEKSFKNLLLFKIILHFTDSSAVFFFEFYSVLC